MISGRPLDRSSAVAIGKSIRCGLPEAFRVTAVELSAGGWWGESSHSMGAVPGTREVHNPPPPFHAGRFSDSARTDSQHGLRRVLNPA